MKLINPTHEGLGSLKPSLKLTLQGGQKEAVVWKFGDGMMLPVPFLE